jgi:hypothetical protein
VQLGLQKVQKKGEKECLGIHGVQSPKINTPHTNKFVWGVLIKGVYPHPNPETEKHLIIVVLDFARC